MPRDAYVAGRCSGIEDRLRYANSKSESDPELGAYLADYISVLIAGVVEDCVEYIVVQRACKANDPHLESFVRSSIDRQFRNPNFDRIGEVLARFSGEYQNDYKDSVSREAREALGSIIGQRISLTHLGTAQSHLTVQDVSRYFELIVGILEVVEEILLHDDIC